MSRRQNPTACHFEDCERPGDYAGLCATHDYRKRTHGDPAIEKTPRRKNALRPCRVEGCEGMGKSIGYCPKHFARVKRWGDPLAVAAVHRRAPPIVHSMRPAPTEVPTPERELKIVERRNARRACAFYGCDKLAHTRGFCETHSFLKRKHGDPSIRANAPRGSGSTNKKGYRTIVRPGHPNAMSNGRILEHVFFMAESLGRPLRTGENVHHKNGVRDDNRVIRGHELRCPSTCCNLELWSVFQPPGQRVADKIAWAKWLLSIYEPAALSA